MIAEPRDYDAQLFRGLDYPGPGGNFYFTVINNEYRHLLVAGCWLLVAGFRPLVLRYQRPEARDFYLNGHFF
jgi:hypothetical protein